MRIVSVNVNALRCNETPPLIILFFLFFISSSNELWFIYALNSLPLDSLHILSVSYHYYYTNHYYLSRIFNFWTYSQKIQDLGIFFFKWIGTSFILPWNKQGVVVQLALEIVKRLLFFNLKKRKWRKHYHHAIDSFYYWQTASLPNGCRLW